MHPEAYRFVARAVAGIDMAGRRVLEIGSYNVNGSVRPLFAGCAEYVGIDTRPGRDVDLVVDAVDYDGRDFDIVVCTEVLEHVADPAAIIRAASRALQPGGLLILTAATRGRAPHNIDGGPDLRGEPYRNVTKAALGRWLTGAEEIHIELDTAVGDIYATARIAAAAHNDADSPIHAAAS